MVTISPQQSQKHICHPSSSNGNLEEDGGEQRPPAIMVELLNSAAFKGIKSERVLRETERESIAVAHASNRKS